MRAPPGCRRNRVKKASNGPLVLGASAAFVVLLALYLDTLAPTVLTFDSATLQTRAYVLGIGYPTGYPTYIMLGKLFAYLPFGDVAYRVNLSSAVYGALAGAVIYLTSLRTIPGGKSVFVHGAAGLAALVFATGPTFWNQAIQAEVYSLNVLLVALTLYALLAWRDSRRDECILAAALLSGLSMTAHMTSGLLVPAAVLFVFLVDRTQLVRARLVAKGVGLFVLGLSPYLYLPIRASMDPPANYANPSNLQNFWFILSGGNFRAQMFVFGPDRLPERLGLYYGELVRQVPVPLLAVAALGVFVLLLKDRSLAALLGTLLAGYLLFALEYGISDINPYFIPTYLLLAFFLAAGLGRLLEWLWKIAWIFSLPQGLAPAAILLVVFAFTVFGALDTRTEVDQSGNYEARRVLESVARNTDSGSTVMGQRETSTLRYMQLVEGRREDLEIQTVTTRDVAYFTALAVRNGPTYFVKPGATAVGNIRDAGYEIYPVERGLLYQVRPRDDTGAGTASVHHNSFDRLFHARAKGDRLIDETTADRGGEAVHQEDHYYGCADEGGDFRVVEEVHRDEDLLPDASGAHEA